MSHFHTFISHPLTEAVGWALLHSLWQGAVIAGLLAVVLLVLRRASANARYVAGCVALVAMLAAPIMTTVWLYEPLPNRPTAAVVEVPTPTPTARETPVVVPPSPAASPPPITWRQRIETALPWLVAGWMIGATLLSIRLVGGWVMAQRLRIVGVSPLDPPHAARLRALAGQLGIKRTVRGLRSTLARVPAVIGWWRPVILVPAASLAELSPWQLDAILAHELAHIHRCDYLVNLIQSVIETLLFYHPAVWWIGSRIRAEREHCCDDLAAAQCPNRKHYAEALLTVAEAAPSPLVLAAGDGDLSRRIRRILGLPHRRRYRLRTPASGVIVVTLGLTIATVMALSAYVNAESTEEDSQEPAEVARADDEVNNSPTAQRVIEIPYDRLLEGDMRYNIVIRPGDVIRVPDPTAGFVYIMGEITRPGAYTVPGVNVLTLKQLIASAGGLSKKDLEDTYLTHMRRLGDDKEVTAEYQASWLFDGVVADTFLRAGDVVQVLKEKPASVAAVDKLDQRINRVRDSIELASTRDMQATDAEREAIRGAFDRELKRLQAKRAELLPKPLPVPPDPMEDIETSPITPADLIPDMSEYVIGPGDLVTVTVFELLVPGQESVNTRRVDENGLLRLPVIREIAAAGRTAMQLEQAIRKHLNDQSIVRNAEVSVIVQEARKNTYSVVGEPLEGGAAIGTYIIPKPDFRLLEALAQAKGVPGRTKTLRIFRRVPVDDKEAE